MATAGRPYKLSFDVFTKVFNYQFYPDLTLFATEIYVPHLHYPDQNYEVIASPNMEWRISENNENVLLVFNNPESSSDQMAVVSITRKQWCTKIHYLQINTMKYKTFWNSDTMFLTQKRKPVGLLSCEKYL